MSDKMSFEGEFSYPASFRLTAGFPVARWRGAQVIGKCVIISNFVAHRELIEIDIKERIVSGSPSTPLFDRAVQRLPVGTWALIDGDRENWHCPLNSQLVLLDLLVNAIEKLEWIVSVHCRLARQRRRTR